MVLETPVLTSEDMDVLGRLRTSRERLRQQVGERSPWERPLRRVQLGRAVRGSNSIEGYVVSLDDAVDAVDAVDGEDSLDAEDETRLAVLGYRDALTYVLQVADDPTLTIDRNLIRSLHFLMLKHDLGAPGPVACRSDLRLRRADGRDRLRGPFGRCARRPDVVVRGRARGPRSAAGGARRHGPPEPRHDPPLPGRQRPHGASGADAGAHPGGAARARVLQHRGVPGRRHRCLLHPVRQPPTGGRRT